MPPPPPSYPASAAARLGHQVEKFRFVSEPTHSAATVPIQRTQRGGGRSRNAAKLQQQIRTQQQQAQGRFAASAPKHAKAVRKGAARRARQAEEKRRMKATYLGLDPEHSWQEIIDGDHHEHGAQTFDEGLHAPPAEEYAEYGFDSAEAMKESHSEPGYLESAKNARAQVANSLGERMDSAFLAGIHSTATRHRRTDPNFRPGYRDTGDRGVNVSYNADPDYAPGAPKQALAEVDPEVAKPFTVPEDAEHLFGQNDELDYHRAPTATGDEDNLGIWFKPKSKKAVKRHADKIFSDYYSGLKDKNTEREKLVHIAATHRRLENLHPFRDGNSRTNRLLLHKMLVENRMTPAILGNPLQVHLQSNEEWADTLHAGMGKWREARQEQNRR